MKTISAEHSDISTRATPRSPQRYCKLSQVRICSGSNSSHPIQRTTTAASRKHAPTCAEMPVPSLKPCPRALISTISSTSASPTTGAQCQWRYLLFWSILISAERSDLKGKTIKPFCTNEGSGMGESEKVIKVLCPESTIEKGLSIWGSKAANSEKALKKWL